MDGVITDFDKAAKEQGNGKRPDLYVNYRNLELIPGAEVAVMKLHQDFDVFINTLLNVALFSVISSCFESLSVSISLQSVLLKRL